MIKLIKRIYKNIKEYFYTIDDFESCHDINEFDLFGD